MPKRTPDQGAQPFELRPGVNDFPPFGGMYRAGDPAKIPPHQHHLVVNCRITPEGLKCRPGLTPVFDTGVSECITGLTGKGGELNSLLIYPGAPQGLVGPLIPLPDPDAVVANAMTFRAIWPEMAPTTYSEYVAVLYGAPAKTTVPPLNFDDPGLLSHVIEPLTPGNDLSGTGECYADPVVWAGRACTFMVVNSPDQDASIPALALVAMDLPLRLNEAAADSQRLPHNTPGTDPDPDSCWPFGRATGSSKVVFYPTTPFSGGEEIVEVYDTFVWKQRADSPDGENVGVHELLYFLVRGDLETFAVCTWDGQTQRTVFTKAGLDVDTLPPILGGQKYGCFVLASTDGTYGDWGGYETAAGSWVEFTNTLHFVTPPGGPQPDPGDYDVAVIGWGAFKETPSGKPIVCVIGLMWADFDGTWKLGRGAWAFEWDEVDGGFPNVVATFYAPALDDGGTQPSSQPIHPVGEYIPLETFGLALCPITATGVEGENYLYIVSRHPWTAGQSYTDDSAANKAMPFPTSPGVCGLYSWWIRAVSSRLYCGGCYLWCFEPPLCENAVFDVSYGYTPTLIFEGPLLYNLAAQAQVSKGCLPGIPSAEIGEGYASGEDG